jgi:hypothetical protein
MVESDREIVPDSQQSAESVSLAQGPPTKKTEWIVIPVRAIGLEAANSQQSSAGAKDAEKLVWSQGEAQMTPLSYKVPPVETADLATRQGVWAIPCKNIFLTKREAEARAVELTPPPKARRTK